MRILSPITKSQNIDLLQEIPIEEIAKLYSPYDVSGYFRGISSIALYQCRDSGYRFFYPFDVAGDGDFYEGLQVANDYYPKERFEFSECLRFIKPGEKVLEIGCGDGYFLQMLKNQNQPHLGIDLNYEAVRSAKIRGLNVQHGNLDRLVDEDLRFDVIVMFQVLEHIPFVHEELSKALKLLNQGGKLIVSVPDNDGFMYTTLAFNKYNQPPHHMGLWNRKSLTFLAKHYPLELLSITFERIQPVNYPLFKIHLRKKLSRVHGRLGTLINRIPDSIFRFFLNSFQRWIHGHTCMAVYRLK